MISVCLNLFIHFTVQEMICLHNCSLGTLLSLSTLRMAVGSCWSTVMMCSLGNTLWFFQWSNRIVL